MIRKIFVLCTLGTVLSLTACRDVFDHLYDDSASTMHISNDQLYVDASSWTDWYYIDLKAVHDSLKSNWQYAPSSAWVSRKIPTERVEGVDSAETKNGIYTYWYDVFGKGLSNYEYQSFYLTEPQPEPENWSIAVHRNNVRTNGGEVLETGYWLMEQMPATSEAFKDSVFTADEWSEMDVWTVKDKMLQGIIGNQGIKINKVLSSWLMPNIPPMPPTYDQNNHIFIVRFADGTCAALKLENYMSTTGTKCCLTIKYKYPY